MSLLLRKTARGVTLVELLVGLAILALFSIGIYQFLSSTGRSQKTLTDRLVLQMESRKAFALVADQIQEGTEVVRPFIGETLPFMLYKDLFNRLVLLYLEPNVRLSKQMKRAVYRLVSYTADLANPGYKKANEQILVDSLAKMTFTSLTPNGIQMNATILGIQGEFQFLSNVGLLNIGGLE